MRIGHLLVVAAAFVVLMAAGLDAGRYISARDAVARAARKGAEAAAHRQDPWREVVVSSVRDGLDPDNLAVVMDVRDAGRPGERIRAVSVAYRPEGLVIASLSAFLPGDFADVRATCPTDANPALMRDGNSRMGDIP